MKNELSKTPTSLRLWKRSETRLAELKCKSGVKAADIVRIALDDFLDKNPSAEHVLRAVIKSRARA